jgi:hypothetical protein
VIPETPEVVSSRLPKENESQFASESKVLSSASQTTGVQAPIPWFQSGVVASTPKIIQKKVDHLDCVDAALSP